jgi:hypothetical protein
MTVEGSRFLEPDNAGKEPWGTLHAKEHFIRTRGSLRMCLFGLTHNADLTVNS